MNLYFTGYYTHGVFFGSSFFARGYDMAYSLISKRGLNEEIKDVKSENIPEIADPRNYLKLVDDLKSDDLLHLITNCCWICFNIGYLCIEDILGDLGVLHELAHYRTMGRFLSNETEEKFKGRLIKVIKTAYNIQ